MLSLSFLTLARKVNLYKYVVMAQRNTENQESALSLACPKMELDHSTTQVTLVDHVNI
jgi:hypothetical protein